RTLAGDTKFNLEGPDGAGGSVCLGDSGAPVISGDGRLQGLISVSASVPFCSNREVLATRVAAFRNWIEETARAEGVTLADPNAGDTEPAHGAWVHCADENGFCSFRGTATVRYGADGKYATKTFTDGTRCTNDVFGDPAFGRVKTCDYWH